MAAIERATAINNQHVAAHGSAPNTEQGNRLIAGFVDGWGHTIHYFNEGEKSPKDFLVTSAGPDGEFGNSDDITNKSLAKEKEKANGGMEGDELDLDQN